jgi:hypothetical protein
VPRGGRSWERVCRLGSRQGAASGDIISARKTLMSVIARNMYPLDEMIYTGKINLPRGRGNADSIAAMLQAFPLLFPAHTNAWKAGTTDPASATFADPHVWDQFDFFYKETWRPPNMRLTPAVLKPKRSSGRTFRSCA